MKRLLLPLALTGCLEERIDAAEAELLRLNDEVQQTRELVAAMEKQVERRKRAFERVPPADRLPEGYDPEAALPAPDPARPDVIVLSIDTLRADHLGAWGYERDTSPHLDALAAGGTRFADTWSPTPWTLPSHVTMLSGLLPSHHGVIEDTLRIGPEVPLLQDAFGEAGYGTAGVVATLFVGQRFGFDRGFDFFHDFGIQGAEANNAATVDAEHVFAQARHWATDRPDGEPLFLFLHVYDAHYAYNAPAPFDERFDRKAQITDPLYRDYSHYKRNPLSEEQLAHQVAQYDEEIAYLDDAFGRFVDDWRTRRPALVVVTADHGEELGDRGSWGHAHTLYPEQLHVPWIVNGPGVRRQVVEGRAGVEDVAATVAGLAGVPFPAGDGVDRSSQVRSGATPASVPARFASTSRFRTLRYRWHDPPWDLHVDLSMARRQLCNLHEDPGCTDLRVKQDLPRSEQMFTEMMGWLGFPWVAHETGLVEVTGGILYASDGTRKKTRAQVVSGERFAVHPADAKVRFTVGGGVQGPWAALGGDLPTDGDPLGYEGDPALSTRVTLSDEERAMLEQLGYIQDR